MYDDPRSREASRPPSGPLPAGFGSAALDLLERPREVAQLALLDAALRALAQPTLGAAGLLLEAAEGARELTRAATALVTLCEDGERLTRCAGDAPGSELALVGAGLAAPLLSTDCRRDARLDAAQVAARDVGSLAAVPLVLDGARSGVLEVSSPRAHAFSERDLLTLQLLAHAAGVALARQRAVSGLARALDEKQKSEALFRSSFEHAPIGLALIHPDGRVFRVNRALLELFGHPEADVLGQPAHRFTWPESEGWETPLVRELRRGLRSSFQLDRRYVHRSGRAISARLTLSVVRDTQGTPLHYVAQLEDTSDATAAMEAVTERAELLEAAHDAIMEVRMDGTILYWNPAAEQLYGWSAQEARGKQACELIGTGVPAGFEAPWAEFEQVGRWEGELLQRARDGQERVVSSRWSLRRDRDGTPLSILAVNRDVTARRQAQDALARSEESLAATLRSLTEGVIVTDP